MLKNKKGITLIALVVTIVVLLILAGVTISLLLDENGIIAKSKDARTETRVSQIEDEVGMWKQHNFINKESNQAQESADTMLANLISRKLLTEEEIDRDQELITIKKKDGTIIKEISYSNVTINISKTPATEKSGAVILTVDSVEGLNSPTITNEEELNAFVNSLSEEEQKAKIKRTEHIRINTRNGANLTSFEDALEWHKEQGDITEATEDAFWTMVGGSNEIARRLASNLKYICYGDTAEYKLYLCTVTNPGNDISGKYIATENGTYTFKIQDLVTDKTYIKKVEVTNVDTNLPAYNVSSETGNYGVTIISLKCIVDTQVTSFENAYIIFKGEKIDISSVIRYKMVLYTTGIGDYLSNQGKLSDENEFWDTTQTIILVKDGKEYDGEAIMKNIVK